MILTEIEQLHPNALVAWDRDVIDPPIGRYEVTRWKHRSWGSPRFSGLRHDGIAIVLIHHSPRLDIYNELREKFWRAVLHSDPNPLDVKWWVD